MYHYNSQLSNIPRRFLPFFIGLLAGSASCTESVDPGKVENEGPQQAELSYRIHEYYAHKAIRTIMADFNDTWALERIDSEWENRDGFLRFHFQTWNKEPLVLRAQVDPTNGDVLSMENLDQAKTDRIVHAPQDEIGNVAALELYLSDLGSFKYVKDLYFRDFDIARKERVFLKGFGSGHAFNRVSAEDLVLVRRRSSFEPIRYGQSATTVVYDARTGEAFLKFLGDLLREIERDDDAQRENSALNEKYEKLD